MPPIDKDRPCDICESKEGIEHFVVEVDQTECDRNLLSHVTAYMCVDCVFSKGWMILGKAGVNGTITYYNALTTEYKYSRFGKSLPQTQR